MAQTLLSLFTVLCVAVLSDRSEHLQRLSNYELIHITVETTPSTTIHFTAFGEEYIVELTINNNLIPANVRHTNGNPTTKDGHDDYFNSRTTSCHYLGKVINTDKPSSAAISMCDKRGIRGHIHIDDETLVIYPSAYYMDTSKIHHLFEDEHIIYKTSDENVGKPIFGAVDNPHLADLTEKVMDDADKQQRRRQLLQANGGTNIVELNIFFDPSIGTYYKGEYTASTWYEQLTNDITDVINRVSGVYASTSWGSAIGDISLTIVEFEYAEAWSGKYASLKPPFMYSNCLDYDDEMCAIKGNDWIDVVEEWVNKYKDTSTFDNFMIVHFKHLSDPTVTNSWTAGWGSKPGVCQRGRSNNNNRLVPRSSGSGLTSLGETIAHELGHNFGASHDQDHAANGCNENSGLMGYGRDAPFTFSSCSIMDFNSYFSTGNLECLARRSPAIDLVHTGDSPQGINGRPTSAPTVSPDCLTMSNHPWGGSMNGDYQFSGSYTNDRKQYYSSGSRKYFYYTGSSWYIGGTAGGNSYNAYCPAQTIYDCDLNFYFGDEVQPARLYTCGGSPGDLSIPTPRPTPRPTTPAPTKRVTVDPSPSPTRSPITPAPTTPAPTTPAPTTPAPTTPAPTTPAPTTAPPTTAAPTIPGQTPQPTTPAPTTPAPTTPAPTTPAPTTPAPTTPAPTTPAPTTPAPTTPAPTTPSPTAPTAAGAGELSCVRLTDFGWSGFNGDYQFSGEYYNDQRVYANGDWKLYWLPAYGDWYLHSTVGSTSYYATCESYDIGGCDLRWTFYGEGGRTLNCDTGAAVTKRPTIAPTTAAPTTASPTASRDTCGCTNSCYTCLTLSLLEVNENGNDLNGIYNPTGECMNDRATYVRSDNAFYIWYNNGRWYIGTSLNVYPREAFCISDGDVRTCSNNWYRAHEGSYWKDFTSPITDGCNACDSCFTNDNVQCLEDVSDYKENVCLVDRNNTVFNGHTNFEFLDACAWDKPMWSYSMKNNLTNETTTYYLHYDKYYQYEGDSSLSVRWIISAREVSINGVAICEEEDLLDCSANSWIVKRSEGDYYEKVIEEGMTFINSHCDEAQGIDNKDDNGKSVDAVLIICIVLAVCAVFVGIAVFFMCKNAKKKDAVKVKTMMDGEAQQTNIVTSDEPEIEVEMETERIVN